ncbi:MAG: YwaF family protein [Clostridia bacterium]|nr:YwaF family protein [Clostridia bacterium]
MLWGSFGVVHILSLVLAAGIIVGLFFALRKASDQVQTIVLGVLSFSGISAVIFNLLMWNSPLEYLPFHLCSLNALVLPFAVFTKNKVLNNLLLLWALGAVFALVVNTAQANYEIFSWTFFFYYFPHTLEIGIPILTFALKRTEKDLKCILWTVLITLGALVVIHFINLGVNRYCIANNVLDWAGNVVQVNYMYTLRPENPLLQLFYNLIPYEFWYMLLCVPIALVYLAIVYLPDIIRAVKARKAKVGAVEVTENTPSAEGAATEIAATENLENADDVNSEDNQAA